MQRKAIQQYSVERLAAALTYTHVQGSISNIYLISYSILQIPVPVPPNSDGFQQSITFTCKSSCANILLPDLPVPGKIMLQRLRTELTTSTFLLYRF